MKIACVLLASGDSVRFGSNKLLHEVNGKKLINYALDAMPKSIHKDILIVTQYKKIADLCMERGLRYVVNDMCERGIGKSIHLGLKSLGRDYDGYMFSVCDQPFLTVESVKKLIEKFTLFPQNIVALGYNSQKGNPVIFPKDLYDELNSLFGDCGGSYVLKKHKKRLIIVEAGDVCELIDIDYS